MPSSRLLSQRSIRPFQSLCFIFADVMFNLWRQDSIVSTPAIGIKLFAMTAQRAFHRFAFTQGSSLLYQSHINLTHYPLRRLPHTGGIVFGIRTTIESLQQIKADAARANHLLEAIEQLPPTAQSYKSLLPLQSVLLSYLRG